MSQFKVYQKGMEVNGRTIQATIELAGSDIQEILAHVGFNEIVPDEHHWYSQAKWLIVFKMIAETVGPRKLFMIGQKVSKKALFPPASNLLDAMKYLDIAYHMNHRNEMGQVLYDRKTKLMLEGIGHYDFKKINSSSCMLTTNNPYPCDFDNGLIFGIARKFNPTAKVSHDDSKPCRKGGADSCTYIISY